MKFLKFRGYGVGAPEININAEKIVEFHAISYNGKHGTEIVTSDGQTIRVDAYPEDVRRELESV